MNKLRLMIVDDENAIRMLIGDYLEDQGHEVQTFEDGESALEAFDKSKIDVVISDLDMPGMGGLEFVKAIKKQSPATVCIILTGFGDLEVALSAFEYGCDDFLLKPLRKVDLLSLSIERCWERRSTIMMASATARMSEIKDDIISLFYEEFSNRLCELEDVGAMLEEAMLKSSDAKLCKEQYDATLERMKSNVDELESTIARLKESARKAEANG